MSSKSSNKSNNKSSKSNSSQSSSAVELLFAKDRKAFNIDNLKIHEIDTESGNDKIPYFAKVTYAYDGKTQKPLLIVTDSIVISKGGIPGLDGQNRVTDSDREYMYMPYDTNQDACNDLFHILKQIDDKMEEEIGVKKNSDKFVRTKNPDKQKSIDELAYSWPLIGQSQPDTEKYPNATPYHRCKMQFWKKYEKDQQASEPKEILTELYIGKSDEREPIKTVGEFAAQIPLKSKCRFIIQLTKIWISRNKKKGNAGKFRECGLSLCMKQIYLEEKGDPSGGENQFKRPLLSANMRSEFIDKSSSERKRQVDSDDDNNSGSEKSNSSDKKKKKNVSRSSSRDSVKSDQSRGRSTKRANNSSRSNSGSSSERKTKKSNKRGSR